MARIARLAPPIEWSELHAASKARGETNDCAVVALSILANVSYEVAHAALAKAGRKSRSGTYMGTMFAALRALGCTITRVDPMKIVNQYPHPHYNLKNMTTHHPVRFSGVFQHLEGKFLMVTASHVAALVDGRLLDWSQSKAMRVEALYRIA